MADDPRDASKEVPISKPLQWEETSDPLSSFSILMSGISMVTRSKQIVWPAFAIALTAYTSQHPIRMKEGGNGISPLLFAIAGIIITYLPTMILPAISTTSPLS